MRISYCAVLVDPHFFLTFHSFGSYLTFLHCNIVKMSFLCKSTHPNEQAAAVLYSVHTVCTMYCTVNIKAV